MRPDPLLTILFLLQVNKKTTARQLAERLEVSERTILRDMNVLSGAGIPVMAERGTGGGWSLLQPYRTDLTGLNSNEIQSIFLTTSSRLLADLGLGKAADAALIKLFAALPALSRNEVEFTRARLHVDGAGWYRSDESFPFLSSLQDAVWQERKVQLEYQRGDGTCVERLVAPVGLVAKGSIWYVVAAVDDVMRTYRVSRVRGAIITNDTFARPADFDLAAYWEKSVVEFKATVPRLPVTVRVAPDVLARLLRTRGPHVDSNGDVCEDGRVTMNLLFEVEDEALDYLLRFGADVETIEPLTLRDRIREIAQRMAAIHA